MSEITQSSGTHFNIINISKNRKLHFESLKHASIGQDNEIINSKLLNECGQQKSGRKYKIYSI